MSLLACPFCREMFTPGERNACPVCGVSLVTFERLKPSDGGSEDGVAAEPEWEPLPLAYAGRGRGGLVLLAALGLAAFFAPWVSLTVPEVTTYTGFDIARRLGWAWAAGVAWFVLLPVAFTRRSIMQMRGARVAASFLAAIPGTTAALLLARPPHGIHGVPLRFTFGWGLHATWVLSAVALVLGVLFGGRTDDIRVKRGSSAGQVVH